MAKERKIQVGIVADASKFKKGLDDSKAAVKDFQRVVGSALGALDSALGGAISSAQRMTGAIKGAVLEIGRLNGAGKSVGAALSGAMATATTAIAGLGIGAAVAGFKLLNSEAEAFKATVQGASIEMATTAYIDTYRQVVHDINTDIGAGAAEAQSKWRRFFGTVGSNMTSLLFSGSLTGEIDNIASALTTMGVAKAKAAEAATLQKEIYDLQRKQISAQTQIAEWDAQIADLKYRANLETYTAVERAGFLAQAQDLINSKYDTEVGLQEQITRKQQEMADLASNSVAAENAVIQSQVTLTNLGKQRASELRELTEKQNTLNRLAAEELATVQALAASRRAMAGDILPAVQLPDLSAALSGLSMPEVALAVRPVVEPTEMQSFTASLKEGIVREVGGTTLAVGLSADTSSFVELTQQVQGVLESLAVSAGEALGQLMGDLLTGGDAWDNFTNAALSAFGDLAIQVGKMAIGVGMATLGIKAALESLNPAVAIAAGVALVALGAAVKAGLSNIASGSYSASTNVASAGSYSALSGSDYAKQEVTVKVTGTLRGSGRDLLATLEEAQNAKLVTT